jgi:hypothetical protein
MKVKVTAQAHVLKGKGYSSRLAGKTYPASKVKENDNGSVTITDEKDSDWTLPAGYFEEVK